MSLLDASLLAGGRLLARAMDPIAVYERTGVLPHRPASHEPYVIQRHAVPSAFVEPSPLSTHPPQWWLASPVPDFAMAHTVAIEAGFASQRGDVYDASGHVLAGASHKYRDPPRAGWVPPRRARSPKIEKLSGEVAVLTAHGQDMYFHWLFDVLPRFARIEMEGREPDHLYARAELAFQRETLTLLGIDPNAIHECAARPLLGADRLLVPCHEISKGREFPGWVVEWLRGRMLSRALEQSATGRGERIYIARSGTGHRNVANQEALQKRLALRGFEMLRLEEMPVAEQVRCFHEARLVVAPHGSGLANLVFCNPGARVVELFPGRTIDLYFRLCHAVGLEYTYVTAPNRSPSLGTADYDVDLDALEATFELLGI